MTFAALSVVASIGGFFWGLGGFVLCVLCLLLIIAILIQDSKEGGLGGAFGAGSMGGEILGARAQRDIVRFTAYCALLCGVLVLVLGLTNPAESVRSLPESTPKPKETAALESPPAGTVPAETAPAGTAAAGATVTITPDSTPASPGSAAVPAVPAAAAAPPAGAAPTGAPPAETQPAPATPSGTN